MDSKSGYFMPPPTPSTGSPRRPSARPESARNAAETANRQDCLMADSLPNSVHIRNHLAERGVSPLRFIITGSLVGIAYYVGAIIGFALTLPGHSVSTLWPPNAILLVSLLLVPTRMWWLVLLSAFPAHLAIQLQSGVPLLMILGWFVSNSSEAL